MSRWALEISKERECVKKLEPGSFPVPGQEAEGTNRITGGVYYAVLEPSITAQGPGGNNT